jgi:hypothetical protein
VLDVRIHFRSSEVVAFVVFPLERVLKGAVRSHSSRRRSGILELVFLPESHGLLDL